jgi:AAA+ superfamily predicted ATPase
MAGGYDDFDEGLSLEHEYHNLGNDYYKIGEFDKAIEHYNKALELRPDLLETFFNRGLAYTRKGFYDKALEDLNKVIELNPNLAEAYYTRGLVHEYRQDYNQAIVEYNKALEVDPNYTKADSQRKVAESKRASVASGGTAPGGYVSGGGPQSVTPGAGGGEGGNENLTKFKVMEKPKMNFKDVAGLEKMKDRIYEFIVYPLKDPVLAKKYGKEAGGGVIFYGPPGTGKTFIAKAAAGEGKSNFISIKMSDIVDMYAGNTEKNLHNAFETARQNKPCILFFDELDGIAGKREGMDQSFEKRSINQFLMEMDGAEYSNEGVLIVGATNAPWDVDAALRRAGRFSKTVYFPEPDKKTRATIVKLNLKNRPVDSRLNVWRIARMTEGYSSADLKSLVDAAASVPWKEALKTGKERNITFSDFKKASIGDDGVRSSLPAWYGSVKKKLIEDEEDEDGKKKKGKNTFLSFLIDILTMGPPAREGEAQTTTVKHKGEQKGLLGEEERRIFDPLIRDINKRTDAMDMGLRKARTLFARYVF